MPLEEFKLSFTKEDQLAKTNPPDLELVNPTLIQDLQEAVNGKMNSNLSQAQQLNVRIKKSSVVSSLTQS